MIQRAHSERLQDHGASEVFVAAGISDCAFDQLNFALGARVGFRAGTFAVESGFDVPYPPSAFRCSGGVRPHMAPSSRATAITRESTLPLSRLMLATTQAKKAA